MSPTYTSLLAAAPWRPLPSCPGRSVWPAPSASTPTELVGSGVPVRIFRVDSARDPVYVATLDDGGLISYRHADGRFIHTLNTPDGLARKLDQLGIHLDERHAERDEPSRWLIDNADLLPRLASTGGVLRALDVACGSGRHALWLAGGGFATDALDRDAAGISRLRLDAQRVGLPVEARIEDLERPSVLGGKRYDVIVVFRYLHRPLFAALRAALQPKGVLVYETFTVDQAARGKPSNPLFLLQHGELPALVAPLQVLRARTGDFDGGMVASVIARKGDD